VARGRIELICGCMFSGKTRELLARLAEAGRRGRKVAAFKHGSDNRYSQGEIVSHDHERAAAVPVTNGAQIVEYAGDAEVIGIDEAQFFGEDLPEACRRLAERGCDVVAAGLDLDSWGLPFGPMPRIEAIADRITRLTAVCARCGAAADHTQRLAPVEGQTLIGGPGEYEARCEACFRAPPMEWRR